jgi:hypothetical protein
VYRARVDFVIFAPFADSQLRDTFRAGKIIPYASADFDNDWAKECQFMELGVQQMLKPRPHRKHYDHEPTSKENTAEQLADIVKENVRATQPGRG